MTSGANGIILSMRTESLDEYVQVIIEPFLSAIPSWGTLAMNVKFVFVFLALFSLSIPAGADECVYEQGAAQHTGKPAELRHGINLSRWWESGHQYEVSPKEISSLRALGFDFVRLPVAREWVNDAEDDVADNMQRLRCDIISLLNGGFAVIVDLHENDAPKQNKSLSPEQVRKRLEVFWLRLKPAVEGLPTSRILLGLYNEPGIDDDAWWKIQGKLVHRLRKIYPRNTFVVTAGPDGGPWNLAGHRPYNDKNLIYDFHYYQPLLLTHYGADWIPNYDQRKKRTYIPYPVPSGVEAKDENVYPALRMYMQQGWNRARLADDLKEIIDWKKQRHIRLACLEFGVYRPHVDATSRINWLRDMRKLLNAAGIPWALWDYRGGFGLFDSYGHLDESMAKALGLRHNSPP
jgi:endoglucanase